MDLKRFAGFWSKLKGGGFENIWSAAKTGVFPWLLLVLFALVVTFLSTVSLHTIPQNLDEGMIASRDIKADKNYEIVDEEASQKFKEDATAGILPVYDYDSALGEAVIKRIHETFSGARNKYDAFVKQKSGRKTKTVPGKIAISVDQSKELQEFFSERLGIPVTGDQWNTLLNEHLSDRIETAISSLVRRSMTKPIVSEHTLSDLEKNKSFVIRRSKSDAGDGKQFEEKIIDDANQLLSIEPARQRISETFIPPIGINPQALKPVILSLAGLLLEPNVTLDRRETDARREEAKAGVKNIVLKIKAGEMIIREGSRYEPWQIKVLQGIKKEHRRGMYSLKFAGTFLLVLLFTMIPFFTAARFFRRVSISFADYAFMSLVGLTIFALTRLMLLMLPAIHDQLLFGASTAALNYLLPVAGGAMLVRMFLDAEISFVFAVSLAVIMGLFVDIDFSFASFCLITNFTAIVAIAKVDRRTRILKAGFLTGLVGALAAIGIGLVTVASSSVPFALSDIIWSAALAFTGGIGSAVFAMIAAPIVESLSGYISDIKLLELANLNHPLLRELIVRAPGTYHHSHMVGILGEAAAEAIGANSLLVRVGAYYHDVGKMKKPLYFIENAKPGEDKHERLSPNMSALIVSAHVKDGMEMVQNAGIPRLITSMIPEHHGTRLINFFYDKAKSKRAEGGGQKIDPADFTYPGPKPQTREAAILMLADVTEAAVRSLKEKSTTRIQQTVQRMITDIFMEKQLDECELTLKDLNDIARAFMRILLGIYHARIEYPKEIEKPEVSIVDESSTATDDINKFTSQS